jgi:hypothetical protein
MMFVVMFHVCVSWGSDWTSYKNCVKYDLGYALDDGFTSKVLKNLKSMTLEVLKVSIRLDFERPISQCENEAKLHDND